MTFEEARAQFPVLERLAYLQAGSVGPLARSTLDAMVADEERWLAEGKGTARRFEHILELREVLRRELGALVGVDSEHVAITASTTDGCNIVLAGLDLGPEDEVVTTTDEHPRGALLRAYDKATGKEVGGVFLPAAQSGSPMSYQINGRQFIVVAISGGPYSGEYVAFSLPPSEISPAPSGARP